MREVRVGSAELRRALIAWTGLTAPIRASVAETVARLGMVQVDPMQVVAPAHLWTLSLRRGPTRLAALDRALRHGEILEAVCGVRSLVHVDDAPAMVSGWRRRRARNRLAERGVEAAARHVLAAAEDGRAFAARSLVGGERVTGFWDAEGVRNTKATSVAVDLLWAEGRLAVVGRTGGQKLYRLMGHHLPQVEALIAALPDEEADAAAVRHSLRTWGLFWSSGSLGWGAASAPAARRARLERLASEGAVVPVRVKEAPRGRVWAVPELLALIGARPSRGALLAPLDNLLWHRDRLETLFGFRYRWEAYVPSTKRTASAYNMPVLTGARFWGEADARWREGALDVRLRPAAGQPDVVPAAVERAVRGAGRLARRLRGGDGRQGTKGEM